MNPHLDSKLGFRLKALGLTFDTQTPLISDLAQWSNEQHAIHAQIP